MRILTGTTDPAIRLGVVTGRRADGRYAVTVAGNQQAADSPLEIASGATVAVRDGLIIAVGRLTGAGPVTEVALDE